MSSKKKKSNVVAAVSSSAAAAAAVAEQKGPDQGPDPPPPSLDPLSQQLQQQQQSMNEPLNHQHHQLGGGGSILGSHPMLSTSLNSRSMFRAPPTIPLDGKNYLGWVYQMRSLLQLAEMWKFVDPSLVDESNLNQQDEAMDGHLRHQAHFILVSAIKDPNAQALLNNLPYGDPRAVWVALERHYLRLTPAAAASLKSQFWRRSQKSNESVREFADGLLETVQRLRACGDPPSDRDICSVFVTGLLPALAHPVVAMMTMLEMQADAAPFDPAGSQPLVQAAAAAAVVHGSVRSSTVAVAWSGQLERLVEIARGEESRLSLHRGNGAAHGSRAGGSSNSTAALGVNSKQKSQHNKKGGVQCHNCKQVGHYKRDCPRLKSTSSGGQQDRNASNTATPAEVAAGACPLPNHKHHKVADCKAGGGRAQQNHNSNNRGNGSSNTGSISKSVLGFSASASPTIHVGAMSIGVGKAVLDSGAGRVIVPPSTTLTNQRPSEAGSSITVANGQTLHNPVVGSAFVDAGNTVLRFDDALQHPSIDRPLIGVSSVLRNGTAKQVVFERDRAVVLDADGKILFTAWCEDGVYVLDPERDAQEVLAAGVDVAAAGDATGVADRHQLLHLRLGHRSFDGIRKLINAQAVRGLDAEAAPPAGVEKIHRCHGCALAKAHRAPFGKELDQAQAATQLLGRVHSDTAGPLRYPSLTNAVYFTLLKDEYAHYVEVVFAETKDEVAAKVQAVLKQWQTLHGKTVIEFHSDGGTEFSKLQKFFSSQGTLHSTTVPNTPQHDGKAEREVRTIIEDAHAALAEAGAAKKFWAHAVSTAVYTRNRTLLVKGTAQTPFERWTGHKPDLNHLRVWGCDADVVNTVAPGQKLPKLSPKSRLCMFVGYDADRMAYLFYDPSRASVIASRDAKFYANSFKVAHEIRRADEGADDGDHDGDDEAELDEWLTRAAFDGETRLAQIISLEEQAAAAPSSGSDAAPKDSKSETTPLVEELDDAAVNPDSSAGNDGVEVRRSTRVRHGVNRYGMVGKNLAQGHLAVFAGLVAPDDPSISIPLSAHTIPKSFAEAVTVPEWRAAIRKELESHQSNGTWKLTTLPAGRKAIGFKWVFVLKLKADGSIDRYKARLTAQGFAQREGVDYNETFAPVLHYITLRIVLAFVAAEDYELHQMDVETAFLNAKVKEELYMKVPPGIDAPDGMVLMLLKALYGIRQAPHEWHADISETLTKELHYTRSVHDSCLFLRLSRTRHLLIIPLFVDDAFPAFHADDRAEMQADIAVLKAKYKLKYSESAHLILGIRITRDRVKRTITLDQEVYLRRVLDEAGMSDAKEVRTPCAVRPKVDPSITAPLEANHAELLSAQDKASYASIVGALNYACVSTRPDIAYAVNQLARALANPTSADLAAAHHLLAYLKGTISLGITFGGSLEANSRQFIAYCDADFAGEKSSARSTTGWVMKIGTGPIAWKSQLQSVVALSSGESEYISAGSAGTEIVSIRGILGDMRAVHGGLNVLAAAAESDSSSPILSAPTTLLCDNTAAKALAESQKHRQRTKHINVRYHYIRQLVETGVIRVDWISTHEQQADLLTKALPPAVFLPLRTKLMGN